jgi:hypothetical protein
MSRRHPLSWAHLMKCLRRRLRVWAAASLVMQSAWLFALMPADCCAAHQPAKADTECHESPASPTGHHIEAAEGAVCPMHHGAGQANTSAPACSMRANCAGPMSALISMLAVHGILAEASSLAPPVAALTPPRLPLKHLTNLDPTPDSPPPRA